MGKNISAAVKYTNHGHSGGIRIPEVTWMPGQIRHDGVSNLDIGLGGIVLRLHGGCVLGGEKGGTMYKGVV